jgi:uncharacterized membrane protein
MSVSSAGHRVDVDLAKRRTTGEKGLPRRLISGPVFAVGATILVLELSPPASDIKSVDIAVAYLVEPFGYLLITIVWANHHQWASRRAKCGRGRDYSASACFRNTR